MAMRAGQVTRIRDAHLADPLFALKPMAIWRFMLAQSPAFWFVLAYAFLEYVRPQQIYPALDVIPWSRVVIPLGLGFLLLEGKTLRWGVTENLLALFTLIVMLSSVLAVYPEESYSSIALYFQWMIIYLFIANTVTTERRFLVFLLFYLLWSLKMARTASWSWAMDGFVFRGWGAAGAPGWFGNSGELGIQMCIYTALIVACLNGLRRYLSTTKRVLGWAAAAMGAVAVAATSSRGAELAGISVILWLVFKSSHRRQGLTLAVLLAILVALVLPPEQIERMRSSGSDRTSLARKSYWAEGRAIVEQYPALGIGFNNWARYHKVHYGFVALPHNIFIEAASQLGYPGLLIFVSLIILTLIINAKTRQLVRSFGESGNFMREMAHGLDASLIAFVVAGYFVTVLFYPYFWINLAMTVALNRAAQDAVAPPRVNPIALVPGWRATLRKRTGFRFPAATGTVFTPGDHS